MSTFCLYRLKVYYEPRPTLFREDITRNEFIYNLIRKKPSQNIKESYVWHIGNVSEINETGLIFAVGRQTITSKEIYDKETGDFIEEDDERAPYTYCVYDLEYGVLAIMYRSKLTNKTTQIANKLKSVLNNDEYTKKSGIRIDIDEIDDPTTFIDQIKNSYAVTSYTLEFSLPNPINVNKDFQEPMQRFLAESSGERGRTSVQGNDLNKNLLEDITRSIASTGDYAEAKIKESEQSKPVKKSLKGNITTIYVEYPDIKDSAHLIIEKLKQKYKYIRGQSYD